VAVLVPAAERIRVREGYPSQSAPKALKYHPNLLDTVRYVALGDSYTVGTSVAEAERWPNQLVVRLRPAISMRLVANLGVQGYSSRDLIEQELAALARLTPQFVTVQVGVNDVVQRTPDLVYDGNTGSILDTLLAAVGPNRIVAVSSPDYTLTPLGIELGNVEQRRTRIARLNEIMARRAAERAIRFVRIDDAANKVATDSGLVAEDRLHPSARQYAMWVDLIAPAVIDALATPVGSPSG